jgi:ferrochelatase
MIEKIAVVLMNLGGPSDLKEVKPFLFSLFYDKAIITLPNPFRFMIAKLISNTREKKSQHLYSLMGGKSPILEETIKQSNALMNKLSENPNYDFKTFVCMRHSKPNASDVVAEISQYKPDQVILLPLYPQFSTTTTGSAVEEFKSKFNMNIPIKLICCYPNNNSFIKAHVELIDEYLKKLNNKNAKIIFSAHGLPLKTIKSGDPYQYQVELVVKTIMEYFPNQDYIISYQSKVGPLEWLGPNTEDVIKQTSQTMKSIVLVPIAFVSEHVETLVELDIEYKQIATDLKIEYIRVPTLGVSELFIKSLSDMIMYHVNNEDKPKKICKEEHCKCINK